MIDYFAPSIDSKIPPLGQALVSTSLPVVLPQTQINALTPPPAITGFNLESTQQQVKANQLLEIAELTAINAKLVVDLEVQEQSYRVLKQIVELLTPPPPPPSVPKIIQSIPMQDALGVLVWKNILDDGTFTYTLQNGTAYAGAINTLLLPTQLIVATDNYSMQLPAGDYTRAQVLAQAVTLGYTLGKTKINQVQFVANNGGFVLKNTAGAVQMTADDFTNTDHLIKGNSIGTQLEEVDDFKVTITGNVLTNLIIF